MCVRTAGEYRLSPRGRTLEVVGFIHCGFEDQVDRVASALFAGKSGLVLLTIDPVLVHAEIRHEHLDRGDELFPHPCGPLILDAVIAVKRCKPPPS
jgi:glutathione S-transferase